MGWNPFKKNKTDKILLYRAVIQITVPEGYASKVSKGIVFNRMIKILILKGIPPVQEIIDETTIKWTIETTLSKAMAINKRLAIYDKLVSDAFNNKLINKAITKKFSLEEQEQVKKMLLNHTKIEILNLDPDKDQFYYSSSS